MKYPYPLQTHETLFDAQWQSFRGLSEDRIIEAAIETGGEHPNPPNGPKALDRFIERAAQRDAIAAADTAKPQKRRRASKTDHTPRLSTDDLAASYTEMVSSDRYMPVSAISNTTRAAMLARGLATPELLGIRGQRRMAWCHVPLTDCRSAQVAEALIWVSCLPKQNIKPAPLSNENIGLGQLANAAAPTTAATSGPR